MKTALRVLTLAAAVLFIALQIVFRRPASPVVVRLKPQLEIAKLPVSADSYPCLIVTRTKESEPLGAKIEQCSPALNNDADIERYEVDLRSGLFILRRTDLFLPDSMPLALTRAYRLWDNHSRAFGIGGNHPYDIFPYGDQFPYTYMELTLGDGTAVHYNRISEGTGYADFVAAHHGVPPIVFENSRVQWSTDHWDLSFQDGTVFRFPDSYKAKRGVDGALIGMRNPQGGEIKFVRDARHNLMSITSPAKHQIKFVYDEHDRIIAAADDEGNVMNYAYDGNGGLSEVRENGRVRWRYFYDGDGMTKVREGERNILLIRYSLQRVASMTLEKGRTYHFDYLVTRRGKVEETMVTDPSGTQSVFKF